jgi:hypothetical protein
MGRSILTLSARVARFTATLLCSAMLVAATLGVLELTWRALARESPSDHCRRYGFNKGAEIFLSIPVCTAAYEDPLDGPTLYRVDFKSAAADPEIRTLRQGRPLNQTEFQKLLDDDKRAASGAHPSARAPRSPHEI